jgi:nuclear GTP-binding protein
MVTKKISKPKKSKRISTKEKVKVGKKIRESKRKLRKEFKKMKKLGINKKKKSKGEELKIPNLCPFKRNLLEQLKRKKNGEQYAAQLEGKNLEETRLAMLNAATEETVGQGLEIEEDGMQTEENTNHPLSQKVRNNLKPLKHIFENADVILEILDARDPMGCRCLNLEKQFLTEHPDKKIILVINKIDLVPLEIAKEWKDILSREFPTVLFKSNLQEQSSNLSTNKLFAKSIDERKELAEELISSAKSVGAEKLLEIVKNYSRTDTGKVSAITVGVIGYPNVGKSSVINSLTKRRVVGVSSMPGFTKTIQEVEVDSKVTLIDCPGVVLSSEDEITLLLRNTIKAENVQDLERAVAEIMRKVKKDQLLKLYKISDYTQPKEFIIKVAEKKGKIKKGGVLHMEETMRMIIQDWNLGKIRYYVPPPMLAKESQTIFVNNN